MRTLCALIALPVFLAAQPPQKKKPVTLESLQAGMARMMGAMAGAPMWTPGGKTFAYTKGDKMVLYDVASGQETEMFPTAGPGGRRSGAAPASESAPMEWENRRVSERPMQWSADGTKMLIVRGGNIFLWTRGSDKVEQLIATEAPERDAKLSPDGTKVSFRRGVELYVFDIASKKETRLTFDGTATRWNAMLDWVYPEELDLGTAHWWSPDSKRIAYLQFDVSREPLYPHGDFLQMAAIGEPQRYPKAGTPNADVRVGVVDAAGGPTRWMDYGEIRDHLIARIHWTPDSKSVLAHRLNRVQNRLQILSASAATGEAATLIEERDDAWINLTDDFRFLSDGRILRTSEKDGFRHVYLSGADGKKERRLTRGDWEVSGIACVDERSGKVYYTSTEASPLERQLYVVGFDGRGKARLSQGEGTHTISMGPACDFYLDTYSSLELPSRGTLRAAADAKEIKVWREPDTKITEEYEILKTEIHKFTGADGTVFYGRLIKPAGFDASKKYPVLVSVYGGPHAQSVRNSWAGTLSWDQVMAHKGFVIWQMDNRGSAGRGHKFEAPLFRRMGKQELDDQKEGVKYLVSLGFADANRVGIYGWSYGGYMTLYSLLHAPEVFKAGSAGAAVTDWRNYDTIYTERYMGLPQENEEGYKLSSPVSAAANLKGRLLLLHNIEDDNVLFANCLQMINALQLAGKQFDMVIYPQKSHGVTGRASQHMREQQTRFFEEALK